MNVIKTYALTKAYGSVRAVDGLDMRVAQGDIYGFVGKNGAGKSTTMKMIAGLDAPTAGTIKLFGAERTGSAFSSAFSRIGALVEQPGLLPNFSAYENLMMKALSVGVVRPREQCRELLELVGLEEVGPRKAKKFSLGMKQRLGLALALVGSPDLLLLDEPFNGIDPEETNGHIDDVACFIRPGEVACIWTDDPQNPFYQPARDAYDTLSQATDAKGRKLKVHKLCLTQQPCLLQGAATIDAVEGTIPREDGEVAIASYMNFLIVNGGVILPQYGDANDALAVQQVQAMFPDRRVVGVQTREVAFGGGNIHCITQQQPAPQHR